VIEKGQDVNPILCPSEPGTRGFEQEWGNESIKKKRKKGEKNELSNGSGLVRIEGEAS